MRTMIQHLVPSSLFLIASLGACASGDITEVATSSDGLVLTINSPDHIAGWYKHSDGTRVSFNSARQGDHLSLRVAADDGRDLIVISETDDDYVFSYMGGRAVMRADKAAIQAARENQDPEADLSTEALTWEGDMNVMDEMLNIPEVRALPMLSRTLGEQGITGGSHPASLALHKIAMQASEGTGVEVPPLETAGDNARCSRPTANNCYGMCGPGCSCWSWVCGNCCYHYGCAKHDSWCREGKWYYCYNITAVIALFGC